MNENGYPVIVNGNQIEAVTNNPTLARFLFDNPGFDTVFVCGLVIVLCLAVRSATKLLRQAFRQYHRRKLISLHGWPPAHLDADGDNWSINLPEEISGDEWKKG